MGRDAGGNEGIVGAGGWLGGQESLARDEESRLPA